MSRWFRTKSDESYADAAEYLCLHEAEVREAVGEQCWAAQIPIITTEEPSSRQWREAIRAVHDAAEAADIPGGLGLRFPMDDEFPPAPAPRSAGWVCPSQCCSRVVLRDGSISAHESSEPQCGLLGRPMRLVE